MSVYIETQDGAFTLDGMTIPNEPANRHYQQMQQEVIDLESTITLYAGTVQELDDAILAKQGEISQEFTSLEGFELRIANLIGLNFEPLATPEATKLLANIGLADAAIIVVGGLADVATVNAYDVAVDPSWAV